MSQNSVECHRPGVALHAAHPNGSRGERTRRLTCYPRSPFPDEPERPDLCGAQGIPSGIIGGASTFRISASPRPVACAISSSSRPLKASRRIAERCASGAMNLNCICALLSMSVLLMPCGGKNKFPVGDFKWNSPTWMRRGGTRLTARSGRVQRSKHDSGCGLHFGT